MIENKLRRSDMYWVEIKLKQFLSMLKYFLLSLNSEKLFWVKKEADYTTQTSKTNREKKDQFIINNSKWWCAKLHSNS